MVYDPHINETQDSLSALGIYGGFKLNTPLLKRWGGMDFITEIVARSINIGFVFPITREYDFSIGITNVENLSSFANQSSEEDPKPLSGNNSALCVGITANIPRISSNKTKKIAFPTPKWGAIAVTDSI